MAQRIIHCASTHDKLLAATPYEEVGRYAGGTVAAVGDEAALSLLPRAPAISLLFFSRESFEYALRRLAEDARNGAVAKRFEQWSGNVVNEGIDWLYRGERRCLTLTAISAGRAAGTAVPPDHLEHTMAALDRLVNEGAYGGSTLPEMLINVLRSEALLLLEMSRGPMTSESSHRNQFSLAIAEELRILGRPNFAQHLPYAEPARGAWVSPADDKLRASLRSRRLPAIDWNGGLVSVFGLRTLAPLSQQGKAVQILYPDGRQFLQELTDLTGPQLEREFTERSKAGALPFWNDYLNFLRLEIALLRRAAYAKAAGSARVATVLTAQIRSEDGLLAAALAQHPSWRNGDFNPQRATLPQAEKDVLDDSRFLWRLAILRAQADVAGRYEAFAAFKAQQLARFRQ